MRTFLMLLLLASVAWGQTGATREDGRGPSSANTVTTTTTSSTTTTSIMP